MRILYSGTLYAKAGGPALSVYNSALGLNALGAQTEVVMFAGTEDSPLVGERVIAHKASPPLVSKFGYSPNLKKFLCGLGDYDIYEAHGVWQYMTYALCDTARRKQRPYLITPRGMLYPQDISKSNKFFKQMSLALRLLKDLNEASCVHTTCLEEMRYCRELGVKSPVCVVPNPIEINDFDQKKEDGKFRLGYIGRLSPRKNVQSLIYAFAELNMPPETSELVVIGGGDDAYEAFLKSEVKRLDLHNVRFLGFLTGDKKNRALASCSVIAMPSEFENMGNVILEGLVRGIPCIATKGTPWQALETNRCGWWVDYSQDSITQAIAEASSLSAECLCEMGRRGRHLVETEYSVPAVASKMMAVYRWIHGEEEKPEWVYVD